MGAGQRLSGGSIDTHISWKEAEVWTPKFPMKSKKPPTAATMEECLSMTPLGLPVEPDVYLRRQPVTRRLCGSQRLYEYTYCGMLAKPATVTPLPLPQLHFPPTHMMRPTWSGVGSAKVTVLCLPESPSSITSSTLRTLRPQPASSLE